VADEDSKPARVYGTPMGTETPGQSTASRPQAKEADPNVRKQFLDRALGESQRPAKAQYTQRSSDDKKPPAAPRYSNVFRAYEAKQRQTIDDEGG
jgi:hypothetical protein